MLNLSKVDLPQKERVIEDILTHGHRDQSRTIINIDKTLHGRIYQPSYEKRNDWNDIENFFTKLVGRKVTGMWGISYDNDVGCKIHNHPQCARSAIYYLRVGEDAGALVFPELGVTIQPSNNYFVEFDAELLHGVDPSSGRICLVMNF